MYMAQTNKWYLERIIWLVAGSFTTIGTIGAAFFSPYWLILTALVGINLLIFAFTGFCLMANILYALGARPNVSCDVMYNKGSQPEGNGQSNAKAQHS